MCGIVGYVGDGNASEILIDGLKKLEYRGYDSAGIAVCANRKIRTEKRQGRLAVLENYLNGSPVSGTTGIGHTRWATHGAPSDQNAHPHCSNDGLIALVHNGIIENYSQLKEMLTEKGHRFDSETDTEVIVHLIRHEYDDNLFDAVCRAAKQLKGAFALAVICANEPNRIVAVRKDSPLIIGVGKSENFIASDIPAVLEYTKDVYLIENGTYAIVTKNDVQLYDETCNPISQEIFHVTWDADAATKGGYDHFMLKEIHEQPDAIRDTLRGRLDETTKDVILNGFGWTKETLKNIRKIWIVACGTAYYAGTIGKRLIEAYAKIPVETEIASEFRYRSPLIERDDLFIAISQSGETADTLASIRLAKQKGARVLAISNVVGSSIAREADDVLYTWAGPEIAVASTKAYATQIICMYLIAMKLGRLNGNIPQQTYDALYQTCLNLPDAANRVLEAENDIKNIAKDILRLKDMFYIGRGIDYSLSLEGALKMKEISYIHAEAYPAGELKHGPIALLEEGSVIVALCTQAGELLEKTVSNIEEVRARGAYVIGIAQQQSANRLKVCDRLLTIEPILNEAAVIPAVMLLQMLAYYVSVGKGIDVDKPRNLAKSVTVE